MPGPSSPAPGSADPPQARHHEGKADGDGEQVRGRAHATMVAGNLAGPVATPRRGPEEVAAPVPQNQGGANRSAQVAVPPAIARTAGRTTRTSTPASRRRRILGRRDRVPVASVLIACVTTAGRDLLHRIGPLTDRTSVLSWRHPAAATAAPPSSSRSGCAMSSPAYAELHAHSNFSFLDGASAPTDLAARAVELGLSALAVTDRGGLYGVVRFAAAAEEAGLHPVIGVEVELVDALVPDPHGLVIPARRPASRGRGRAPRRRPAGAPGRFAGSAPACPEPPPGPPRGGQGGPARRRGGGAWPSPRPARP